VFGRLKIEAIKFFLHPHLKAQGITSNVSARLVFGCSKNSTNRLLLAGDLCPGKAWHALQLTVSKKLQFKFGISGIAGRNEPQRNWFRA
jgi:hypothetical protein